MKMMKMMKLVFCWLPLLMISTATAQAPREVNDAGARLEDDAWYDVSEWFDGNDYNPADEAIGRWDNEVFEYRANQAGPNRESDGASVSAEEFYGEDYDDGYTTYRDADQDGNFETMWRYYDTDGDHLNDSYATFRDADGDGMYESYDYSEIAGKNAVHPSEVAQSTQKGLSGKTHVVSGTVEERKTVERLGRHSLLVKVRKSDGQSAWVDFGVHHTLQVFEGDEITAYGPLAKRGNKSVLVATAIGLDGRQKPIDRTGRRYAGIVQSTRKANVRGNEHLVAKLKTDDGKMLTVDMGAASSAGEVTKGEQLTVTGVPVKVGDRVVLIADQTRTE